MVIFPASMEVPAGFTFTVGAFIWTTGGTNTVAVAMEVAQASPAPMMTTSSLASPLPVTCRSLPCYPRRQIDNTDLLESIDWVGFGLADTLALVDSIRDWSAEDGSSHSRHHQSS
jgi:hypothetical protein